MTCKFARLSLRRLLVPFMAGALAVIAAPAWAAAPQDLDAFAARAMKAFDTPGMAVAIVEDGQAATHVYGIRKLGAPERVDAHTVFPIGSNTKAFTAAALAILVDQGKLHWDDLVVDKLPGFRMYDAYTSQHMTITDLLVHRSGLGLGQGDLMFLPSTTRSRAELVHAIRHLKPATGFRSGFAYDNVLYSVAGELVEAVSGERWEDFVQRHMLSPMGMRDTLTSLDVPGPDSVSLHGKISGPVRGMGPPSVLGTVLSGDVCAPAGALRVSADDMTHWLRVQLAHGALDGGRGSGACPCRRAPGLFRGVRPDSGIQYGVVAAGQSHRRSARPCARSSTPRSTGRASGRACGCLRWGNGSATLPITWRTAQGWPTESAYDAGSKTRRRVGMRCLKTRRCR